MTQTKTETVTGFIEKLEALQVCFLELSANKTEKFVLYDDLRAIIEQAKAEQSEPVAWRYYDSKWGEYSFSEVRFPERKSEPLYTAPQPTPQNVIDAELGKLVRQKMQSGNDIPVSRCVVTREEYDQAMKG